MCEPKSREFPISARILSAAAWGLMLFVAIAVRGRFSVMAIPFYGFFFLYQLFCAAAIGNAFDAEYKRPRRIALAVLWLWSFVVMLFDALLVRSEFEPLALIMVIATPLTCFLIGFYLMYLGNTLSGAVVCGLSLVTWLTPVGVYWLSHAFG